MPGSRSVPVAVSVGWAGLGAGVEVDLSVFSILGVYGVAVVSGILVRGASGEARVLYDVHPHTVYGQLEDTVGRLGVNAVKTVPSSEGFADAVARVVEKHGLPLVIDLSKTQLPDASLVGSRRLLGLARVVVVDAQVLGRLVGLEGGVEEAAKRLGEAGAEAVVVKGSCNSAPGSTLLYWRGLVREYKGSRAGCLCEGTGQVYSAAITAGIAAGLPVDGAVRLAEKFTSTAVDYGYRLGESGCRVDPSAWLRIPAEKYWAIVDVEEAVELIVANAGKLKGLVPEVGMNIARIIEPRYARSVEDVVAVVGRIVRYGSSVKPVGPARPGASSHLARALLEAVKHDPSVRAVANIAYNPEFIEKAMEKGYTVVYVDRRLEPPEVKAVEGASIPWIVSEAFRKSGRLDIVYDTGDVGKEAMIRVFGETAVSVARKILDIAS